MSFKALFKFCDAFRVLRFKRLKLCSDLTWIYSVTCIGFQCLTARPMPKLSSGHRGYRRSLMRRISRSSELGQWPDA